jgi:hypothetical protein
MEILKSGQWLLLCVLKEQYISPAADIFIGEKFLMKWLLTSGENFTLTSNFV